MIKLLGLDVSDFRGIRELHLDLGGKNLGIQGPNASGKSGVVDAIEFALTGRVSRLSGEGSKGLSVQSHGPHVDARSDPNSSYVEVSFEVPAVRKTATLRRFAAKPTKPTFTPKDADIAECIDVLSKHAEICLSRRDIVRFVLAEPGKRSQEVQALLKLERLDEIRRVIAGAAKKAEADVKEAQLHADSSARELASAVGVETLSASEILRHVNNRRGVLGLSPLDVLQADTDLCADLAEEPLQKPAVLDKEQARAKVRALLEWPEMPEAKQAGKARTEALDAFAQLEADSDLRRSLTRRDFLRRGLDLLDEPKCPFCDVSWDIAELRQQIDVKLQRATRADELDRLIVNGIGAIRAAARLLGTRIEAVAELAGLLDRQDERAPLDNWRSLLEATTEQLRDSPMAAAERVNAWPYTPTNLDSSLSILGRCVENAPEADAQLLAKLWLVEVAKRLREHQKAKRLLARANSIAKAASTAMACYEGASESVLTGLYDAVASDFSAFYRGIHDDDEKEFDATLKRDAGSLELSVDFYGRGQFSPAAYHSEGHQDSMGLCLYLALMRHVFKEDFRFAVLDDVVMSVDRGHRKKICNLLKTEFPDTQFVITTHDEAWQRQLASAGLVPKGAFRNFHSWSVEAGPAVTQDREIWEKIEENLATGQTRLAAAGLRNHLECVSSELADNLRATLRYRADADYCLGDLLPAVASEWGRLLEKARKSAQSWGEAELAAFLKERKASFSELWNKTQAEQWPINRAVHYTVWADFAKEDLEPVVGYFRDLLDVFRCEKCLAWAHVSPGHGNAETLRCNCGKLMMNLVDK